MSAAGEFIDSALRNESTGAREIGSRPTSNLRYYGTSVGAIRGTVRDASRKYSWLVHDEITALSSELWSGEVFELRLAAIVLLQMNVRLLRASDLTRIEGFVRASEHSERLLDALIDDVVVPLFSQLSAGDRARAQGVIARWAAAEEIPLRRAAIAVLAERTSPQG